MNKPLAVPTATVREPIIPRRSGRRGGAPWGPRHPLHKYPFEKLTEVGQSFFVPNEKLPPSRGRAVRSAARAWARGRGLKYHPFTVKSFPMGVRVTRAAIGDERGNRTRKFPWGDLAVGESFFVSEALASYRGKRRITGLHTALLVWKRNRPERTGVRYRGKTIVNGVLMTRIA